MSLLEFTCTIILLKFMRAMINLYHLLNSKCFMFIRFQITKSTSLNENAQKATLARFALATSADPHGKKSKGTTLSICIRIKGGKTLCRRGYLNFIWKADDKKVTEDQHETWKAFDFMINYRRQKCG